MSFVRDNLPDFLANPDPDIYRSNSYVVLDFETTTIGKGLPLYPGNSIVLSAWELGPDHPHVRGKSAQGANSPTTMRHKWAGEFDLGELVRDIEKADYLVAHNCKFELGWLKRCGLDLSNVLVWDTMIGEYVIGGNRWVWHMLSLEASAQRRLGRGKINLISKMFKAGLCSTEIPASWLLQYCKQDVKLCRDLFLAQREEMDSRLTKVMYTRCLATPVLTDLEGNGMYLDHVAVANRCAECEREYSEVQNEIERITGGINVNSGKQLAEFLYGTLGFPELRGRDGKPLRTGTDRPLTDASTISKLRATTKAQREFLELYVRSKELYNELTKYLRKFRDCCEEVDGHLLAQFNQTNTRTHRLSSSGLDYNTQFQNFPRAYKPFFQSRHPGWLVGEADGAQLEFRVAAHLGRDGAAFDDIVRGTDIHSVTADIIGCSRQDAKAHTFKPLYGGRSGTPEQKRYYQHFREKYRGIADTQQSWINSVLGDKELTTEWGLTYHWPDTRMERSGYVVNSTSICNYPVQAFATAEIIPIGLVYFWHYLQRSKHEMFIVNTVHDSIIVELPPQEKDAFKELSYTAMVEDVYFYLDAVYDIQFTVPLAAGVATSERWGDDAAKADEVTLTATEDLYAHDECGAEA